MRITPLSRSLAWMPLISRPFEKRKRLKAPPKTGPIEVFEDRVLLTTYTVDTDADSGAGSLRQAILDANANEGADIIQFNLDGDELEIQPLTLLPAITDPVLIDGTTQPGFSSAPLVVLNGDLLPDQTFGSGLEISSTNSVIKSLVINGFSEGEGILIGGFDTTGVSANRVEGCIIGLSADGTEVVPNANGIRIANGATSNTIGGTDAGVGNLISGNGTYGILVEGTGTSGNIIQGNTIGITDDPLTDVGNGYGVALANGASSNTIGGTVPGARNVISGNIDYGISLSGENVTANHIEGNWIGLDETGTASYGSFTDVAGISITNGAHGNTIGGSTAARNVIAGVTGDGIRIADEGTSNNTIQGNYLGVNAAGTAAVPINDDGIFIEGASENVIGGGIFSGMGNLISGAGRHGVTIFGSTASANIVMGNMIGTNAAGTAAIPNGSDGVHIDGAPDNYIGWDSRAFRNVISGNGQNGITITGAGATGNSVRGNYLGVQADGTSALGNGIDGIQIGDSASSNQIGSREVIEQGNVIAFNAYRGIEITGNGSQFNTLLANSVYSNVDYPVDLRSDQQTANDALDADNGPNGLQNYPVLTSANSFDGTLTIQGTLSSSANGTFKIDFYSSPTNDDNGHGQGQSYLGTTTVVTSATGQAGVVAVFETSVPVGQVITAMATSSSGNTSEFSASVIVVGTASLNPILIISSTPVASGSRTTPVVLAPTASLSDSDSANFNGGKLTVSLSPPGKGGDILAVRNQGTGEGQISISKKNVLYEGTVIGTMTGGKGKKALVITLNSSATVEATQALIRNITYLNKGKKVPSDPKLAQFQVTDGGGHSSGVVNKPITVVRGS